jgi:hypothetical protein
MAFPVAWALFESYPFKMNNTNAAELEKEKHQLIMSRKAKNLDHFDERIIEWCL